MASWPRLISIQNTYCSGVIFAPRTVLGGGEEGCLDIDVPSGSSDAFCEAQNSSSSLKLKLVATAIKLIVAVVVASFVACSHDWANCLFIFKESQQFVFMFSQT